VTPAQFDIEMVESVPDTQDVHDPNLPSDVFWYGDGQISGETMQGVRDSNRPSDVFSDTWGGTGNLPDACQRNLSRPVE